MAIGGAIFGWFSAKLVTKILTLYVKKNPAVVMKLVSKYGGKTVVKTLSALGLNPVNFMDKGKLVGFIQQVFNRNPKLIMPDSWDKALCKVADKYNWSIRLDAPHNNNWNVWHINIGKYHVAISKAMRKYLQRLGY